MSEKTATTPANTPVVPTAGAVAAKPVADIIRGRMPLVIVSMIKFKETGATVAALATKYKTTVGKISDIQKDRNFGYITKDFAPTQEMINDAKAYAAGYPDKSILAEIEKIKVATPEQAAAFEVIRKASRPGRKAAEPVAPEVKVAPEKPKGEMPIIK